jgi:hypothetical protein
MGLKFGNWCLATSLAAGFTACGGSDSGGGHEGLGGTGGTGGVQLEHCDVLTETSANPIIKPCGDMSGPLGVNVQFGPLGAQMDVNVGKGFENTDPLDEGKCPGFVASFNEDPAASAQLLDVGPQPCATTDPNTGNCLNFTLYSVYRPANWPAGKIPVLTWGNGTCAQPEGYGTLLRYIASYGFFIVAANSREVGSGTEQLHALDFAAAANEDPSSPYYGHLDLTRVGAMGHSQGSASTGAAASDPRIQDVILFNGGESAVKPFFAMSGDLDLFGYTKDSMAAAVAAAPKGAYAFYHNPTGNGALKGHLVLMLTPERVVEQATAFWQMVFQGDADARNKFVGTGCGFCNSATDYDFGENGF